MSDIKTKKKSNISNSLNNTNIYYDSDDEKNISDVKKGPGRPRKNPKKEPIPRKGIVLKPTKPEYVVEFLYDLPIIIKKIISFLKSIAASQIQIIFRPDDIIIYTTDHLKKSRIRVRIDPSKINHYYCSEVIDIGINCKDLENIMNNIDRDYNSIILLSTTGNTKKNITIVLETEIQIDEIHTIDLIGQYDVMEDEEEFTNEDYKIKFTLPGKYFRKTINDLKSIKKLSIQKEDEESPLEFAYISNNKKRKSKHVFNNYDKINFVNNLQEGETFRVDVKIDYLKPISSGNVAEDITIMVDENKKIMTKSFIDGETIEIKTLTTIIDYRMDE